MTRQQASNRRRNVRQQIVRLVTDNNLFRQVPTIRGRQFRKALTGYKTVTGAREFIHTKQPDLAWLNI